MYLRTSVCTYIYGYIYVKNYLTNCTYLYMYIRVHTFNQHSDLNLETRTLNYTQLLIKLLHMYVHISPCKVCTYICCYILNN